MYLWSGNIYIAVILLVNMAKSLLKKIKSGIKTASNIALLAAFAGIEGLYVGNFVGKRIEDPAELRQVMYEEANKLGISTNNLEIVLASQKEVGYGVGGRYTHKGSSEKIELVKGLGNTRNVIAHELYHKYQYEQWSKKLPTGEIIRGDFITEKLFEWTYNLEDHPDSKEKQLVDSLRSLWRKTKGVKRYISKQEPGALLYGATGIISD
jgi:hypothetical protein